MIYVTWPCMACKYQESKIAGKIMSYKDGDNSRTSTLDISLPALGLSGFPAPLAMPSIFSFLSFLSFLNHSEVGSDHVIDQHGTTQFNYMTKKDGMICWERTQSAYNRYSLWMSIDVYSNYSIKVIGDAQILFVIISCRFVGFLLCLAEMAAAECRAGQNCAAPGAACALYFS